MITERRDLRTGEPVWLHSTGIAVRSRSRVPRAVEIVIVGAGISGAMLAYKLRRRGRNVLVLDRRLPLHGSTAASTALLQFEIDIPLSELTSMIGRAKAERAWRRSADAVSGLRRQVAASGIRCGWRDANSLYLAGSEYGFRALQAEVEARQAAGVPGEYLSGGALRERFGIDRTGAILSDASAQANPMQLAAGLFRRAASEGVRICAPVTVTNLAAGPHGVTLATDAGEIAAEHAVFCTGYEVLRAIPAIGHDVKSSWAFASAPGVEAPLWLADHLIWEGADPYIYVRKTRDGRIVAGGEDAPYSEEHADTNLLSAKTNAVAAKLRALLPALKFRIAYRWAGAFGETATGLPRIGAVPGYRNCHAVMGFGGNGITFAFIAAEIVAAEIAGSRDPDADLYRFPKS